MVSITAWIRVQGLHNAVQRKAARDMRVATCDDIERPTPLKEEFIRS